MEKKYLTLNSADNAEYYEIYEENGTKFIHILHYYYKRDDNEKTWAKVDGTFIIVPLSEFIERYAQDGNEYLDNTLWAETKQYQYDMTTEEAEIAFEGTYSILQYSEITMDTPDGCYLSLR